MLGKKIARLRLRGVGKEDRRLHFRAVAVLGKKKEGKGFNFQTDSSFLQGGGLSRSHVSPCG